MLKLKDIVNNSDSLEYRYTFIDDNDMRYIFATLKHISAKIGKPYLCDYVFVILKEVLINAVRACSKRHFFTLNDFDLLDPNSYSMGMEKFKDEIVLNWSEKKDYLKDSKYFVKLRFVYQNDSLIMEVINNTSLIPQEIDRISTRLNAAEKYNSILDAFQDVSDSQESAGLGIVMVILLLRSIGLSKNNLKLWSDDEHTYNTIEIPADILPVEVKSEIRERIISNVQMLPSLPDSLRKIMDMCNSQNLDMAKLSAEIEKNPSLSADLLKLSNSTSFITRTVVKNISQATKIVGSNNILNMLYAVSSYKVMKDKYPKMEKEWEHANKTSAFASKIAREFGQSKHAELIAVGGLLHDIGKILLLSIEGDLFSAIKDLTKNRQLDNTKSIEEASIDITHSELGRMLADKWNYPVELSAMIEFHQEPHLAPEEFQSIVEIVYLANILSNKEELNPNFYLYDIEVLEKFGISSLEQFNEFSERLEKYYRANKENTFFS
jgi:putative nucleotidyltransferase with HDIG domain